MQKVLTLFIRINVCMLMLMCECNSLVEFFPRFFFCFKLQEACSNISRATKKNQRSLDNNKNNHTFEEKSHNSPYALNEWLRVFLLILHFSPKLFFSRSQIFVRPTQKSCHFQLSRRFNCVAPEKKTIFFSSKHTIRSSTNRPWCRLVVDTCIFILCNRNVCL